MRTTRFSSFLVLAGVDADPPVADPKDAVHVTCDACWKANPRPLWTDKQV